MSEDRNFRSYYYDKVGFRVVEEKRSLEFLLKDNPINVSKLSQFCLRFCLPCMYREYVWKLLLRVLPSNPENHESWQSRQRDQYCELRKSLGVMRFIDDSTPLPEVLTLMLLLEEGSLLLCRDQQMSDVSCQNTLNIATAFSRMFTEVETAYYLTRNFVPFVQKYTSSFAKLREKLETILQREDEQLHKHLLLTSSFINLPVDTWFSRCFAEVLPENSLQRIWDKVIGGSCQILVYVGVALFTTLRRTILNINSASEIHRFLKKVPEDTAECVSNKALELWQLNSSGLQR